ncbi:hypothetical protein ACFPN2_21950 [Steroidobacter flavus]|uniref:EfeO-type cupredoxin-like domain-containing protein n=1 Tax=Steroidobacter flavus TaxID=1842136 RepID=A0ABV8SXV6_9GAMM
MLWAAATLVALVALYFGSRTLIGERDASVAPNPTFNLIIAAPRPDEAMTVLPAKQNETVTLRIRSDRAGEVHVHGYDQNVVVAAGSEVVLTFVAKDSGIYPIHLHERANPADPESPIVHRQLAVLEVKAQ